MDLDFKKYKRIFAFGCSFTHYKWPTWADLISLENTSAVYRNYGKAGMGNLAISVRITEAHKRFNFDENDLVLVMWSTFCREDRWINGGWFTQGNVYLSSYPKDWVKEYTDPMGYLIRDHAIISTTNNFIKNLKCDSLLLKSTPIDNTEMNISKDDAGILIELAMLYSNEYNQMPMDLYNFLGDWSADRQIYLDDYLKDKPATIRNDSHPFSTTYVRYLNHIGIELSDNTKQVAYEADALLKNNTTTRIMSDKYDFLRKNVGYGTNRIF